jgi:cyclic pyranopterin monophosphate synthase
VAAKLSHLGKGGETRMVDVSAKTSTERVAVAEGRVVMTAKTLDLVLAGNAKKGDVLGAARIAGIMAAEQRHKPVNSAANHGPMNADEQASREVR